MICVTEALLTAMADRVVFQRAAPRLVFKYRFENFKAVEAWVNITITTVLYLEWRRAKQLARGNLSDKKRAWWRQQRFTDFASN